MWSELNDTSYLYKSSFVTRSEMFAESIKRLKMFHISANVIEDFNNGKIQNLNKLNHIQLIQFFNFQKTYNCIVYYLIQDSDFWHCLYVSNDKSNWFLEKGYPDEIDKTEIIINSYSLNKKNENGSVVDCISIKCINNTIQYYKDV